MNRWSHAEHVEQMTWIFGYVSRNADSKSQFVVISMVWLQFQIQNSK